tara:strand:+ start:5340 stop:5474 length:135 start_codon:yes stop_codon:yes gene_type:complete
MTEWTRNEDGEWVEAEPLMSKEDLMEMMWDWDEDLRHMHDLCHG